ncbi:MAG: hypothetical protein D6814_04510 [Calditrichaeota bacterium]|nr:MAG: hypothetical protein D6814_04510 [Calditrichota bacterium]
MQRKIPVSAIVLFLLLVLMSLYVLNCGQNNPLTPDVREDNEVWIQSDGFHPKILTVAAGTTVKWTNKDNEFHTVDSGVPGNPANLFTSPNIKPGTNWTHKFSTKGSFDYYCSIHQRTARVVVQ